MPRTTSTAQIGTEKTADETTEIVLRNGQAITVRKANPGELEHFFTGGMLEELSEDENTQDVVLRRMADTILTADTAEEIFGSTQTTHSRDVLDMPFTILDVTWIRSDFEQNENSLPMFALIDAVMAADGRRRKITCGAGLAMLALWRAQKKGVLSDLRVMLKEKERPTKRGFKPINFVLAD